MVTITLTNHHPESEQNQVLININTGKCFFNDNTEIDLKHLDQADFIHPLLSEPITSATDQFFHYEYDTIEGMFYSGIYVYARLLRVDNPQSCQFKINPSPNFKHVKFAEQIDISINSHEPAQETISIKQFEKMISHVLGYKFTYSEDVIIDALFTIEELPSSVDGDALYQTDKKLIKMLKKSTNFKRVEIRYINPIMGFGVFSKEIIKKGDNIFFYAGVKEVGRPSNCSFSFAPRQDCFEMYLDASRCGNIARFVNHAPDHNPSSCPASLLEANVEGDYYLINGINIVLYSARKKILPGEQLLVDYGLKYFQHRHLVRFKSNGQLIPINKKFFWASPQKKINHLKIMADNGVKKAQWYIRLRIFFITFIIIGAMKIFHLFP